MIVLDTEEQALEYLGKDYLLAKVARTYPGMTEECLVAGMLMGLGRVHWWYALVESEGGGVLGLLKKELFVSLYDQYYIELTKKVSALEGYYRFNPVCLIQEMPGYRHRINSWKETISTPTDKTENYFG